MFRIALTLIVEGFVLRLGVVLLFAPMVGVVVTAVAGLIKAFKSRD